jgi:hypothetical protein
VLDICNEIIFFYRELKPLNHLHIDWDEIMIMVILIQLLEFFKLVVQLLNFFKLNVIMIMILYNL